MSKRENILADIAKRLKGQRTVKLGRVERDPIDPNELPKTAFPAVYIETVDEVIDALAVSNLRMSTMDVGVVLIVGGKERDKQKNVAIDAIEDTLMEDMTLNGNAKHIGLTRVETISIGESAPFATCRMTFTVEFCYTV
jgi:hypothetical protein